MLIRIQISINSLKRILYIFKGLFRPDTLNNTRYDEQTLNTRTRILFYYKKWVGETWLYRLLVTPKSKENQLTLTFLLEFPTISILFSLFHII